MVIPHHLAPSPGNCCACALRRAALTILFALIFSGCGFVTDHEVGIKVISHRFDKDGNLYIRMRPQCKDVCGHIQFGRRFGPSLPSNGVWMVDSYFYRTRSAPPHASPVTLDPDGTFEIVLHDSVFDSLDFQSTASSNHTVHLWINNDEVAVFNFPAP